ncbi:DUF5941 domain-containing protein [Streptomyces boncukensis]|uniref:CDP-alcohol phosphatidyltransferase family protein n=1 Tax=Streptomyces boncukensis TaxID=2711219 RepID=A0A6G4X1M4_9ACTN|nr:DUF5941 domain-containing protein [Streptomyces boncukensis]NGO71288.1 CDP-alcohol phosphatidyltransferase family protein [Streptomyces boncukensis]
MSTAILTGPPVAGSPLEDDLRSLGFDVRVAEGAAGLTAQLDRVPAQERVALVDPRFVGHAHALRLALRDPRFDAGAVPGAVGVAPAARGALRRALAPLESAAAAPAAASAPGAEARDGASAGGAADPRPLPDAVAAALDAGDVPVHRPELGVLVAAVPDGDAARRRAREDTGAVDDEAVRLRSAVKSRDGFFTTFCVSPYSRYLARWCARRGLTPNQVTTASLVVALIAAAAAATGERAGFAAAGVLLVASFVLDATDGQLARYDLQYSKLGAWLDATFDRAKEYAYYAGLALGAARGGDDVWALALAAMILMTARHTVDFAFNEAQAGEAAAGGGSPTAALSGRLDSVGWTVWARRMIVLPIGERWALIAVLTAVTTPRITLVVLLIAGAFAACYTTAGRVLRSLTRAPGRTDRAAHALAALADSGPLAQGCARVLRGVRLPRFGAPAVAVVGTGLLLGAADGAPLGSVWPVLAAVCYVLCSGLALARPPKGALDWLLPPLFRIAEYATILVLAARSEVNGALPAAFGLVAAVAYHHYDTVYRIRGGTGAPPQWLVRAIGGHEGRTLLVTIAAALWLGGADQDSQGFSSALTALAVVIAAVVLVESIRFWVSSQAPAVHDETGEPA